MKKQYLPLLLLPLISWQDSFAQENDRYQLVWQDDFTRDGRPSDENWTYEKGFERNLEAQWYQQENAYCKDGFLIIEARREKAANPEFTNHEDPDWRRSRDSIRITSSSLTTNGKHSWKFGRFEMRAKIPVAPGMWPAFWTLGVKGRWPANGEIDIMEYYRGKMLANAAWESDTRGKPVWDDVMLDLSELDYSSDAFHVWRMDWNADQILLYLDDKLLNTIELRGTLNGTGSKSNPFHQPHYLLVNLAVGGVQGGDPTYTRFPQKYIIDYIRVYQLTD